MFPPQFLVRISRTSATVPSIAAAATIAGARPVVFVSLDGVVFLKIHEGRRAGDPRLFFGLEAPRRRNPLVHPDRLAGIDSPRHGRLDRPTVELDTVVK